MTFLRPSMPLAFLLAISIGGCASADSPAIDETDVSEDAMTTTSAVIKGAFPTLDAVGLTVPGQGEFPASNQAVLDGYTFSTAASGVDLSHLIQLRIDAAHPEVSASRGVRLGFRVYKVSRRPAIGERVTLTGTPLVRFRAPVDAEDSGDGSGVSYAPDVDHSFFPKQAGNYVLVVQNVKRTKRIAVSYELEVQVPGTPPFTGGGGNANSGSNQPNPFDLRCPPGEVIVNTGFTRFCSGISGGGSGGGSNQPTSGGGG